MARTRPIDQRIYVDGRDMSGYSRSIGPLECTFDEGIDDALGLVIKGVLPGPATINCGTLNGIFDNTATSGIHAVLSQAATARNVMVAIGMGAAPVVGDPVFMGRFMQGSYQADPSKNPVTATINFQNTSALAANKGYARPWGKMLHPLSAATGANSTSYVDGLAQSTKGGFMMYHVTAAAGTSTMTAAIKVQHSDTTTDGDFADLLTTGTIAMQNGGKSGIVALANPTTVKRYVRWQIALGSASSVTFALAFVRNNQ